MGLSHRDLPDSAMANFRLSSGRPVAFISVGGGAACWLENMLASGSVPELAIAVDPDPWLSGLFVNLPESPLLVCPTRTARTDESWINGAVVTVTSYLEQRGGGASWSVLLMSALGGYSGSAATSAIAAALKPLGYMLVANVSLPLSIDSLESRDRAWSACTRLTEHVHSLQILNIPVIESDALTMSMVSVIKMAAGYSCHVGQRAVAGFNSNLFLR